MRRLEKMLKFLVNTRKSSFVVPFILLSVILQIAMGCSCKDDIFPPKRRIDSDSAFSIQSPMWSPDGSKIIFLGEVFPVDGDNFYEVDSSGGIAQMFSEDSLAKINPIISPDGKKIAYLAANVIKLFCCAHVWVMDIDGKNSFDFTPEGGNWDYIRWSPDSKYITFHGNVNENGIVRSQILLAEITTHSVKVLTKGQNNSYRASWTYDGRKIVFSSEFLGIEEIFLMNPNGDSITNLVSDRYESYYAEPSPIRNEIRFYWRGENGDLTSGSYLVNLDTNTLPVTGDKLFLISRKMGYWSPDGNYFAGPFPTSNYVTDLYITSRDGKNVIQATKNFRQISMQTNPWSPDSKHLIFDAIPSRDSLLYSFYSYDLNFNLLKQLEIKR